MNNDNLVYDENDFWSKLKKYAIKIGKELLEKALCLYYVAQEPHVPMTVKTIIYSALAYLVLPIDLVSDIIPGVGYSDDLVVISTALISAMQYVTPEIEEKAQKKLADLFGSV